MWTLECDVASVGRGRRLLGERLSQWGFDEGEAAAGRVKDVLLAATELLGNAARHCQGPIGLAVEAHHDELRVEVSDDHPGRAVLRRPEPDEENGRGLLLVDALADHWGDEFADGGRTKTVWFSVDVPDSSPLELPCRCRRAH